MAVAIEDAGFEIRDQIMWIYGSGFPKSHNISKSIDKNSGAPVKVGKAFKVAGEYGERNLRDPETQGNNRDEMRHEALTDAAKQWDGWGTALKPAHEPMVLARKPLVGTVAANVLTYGTGGLNIDGARVGSEGGGTNCTNRDEYGVCKGHDNAGRSTSGATVHAAESNGGRWPANVIHDGSDEVVALFPDKAGGGHWSKTKVTGYGEFGGGKSEYFGQGEKDGFGSAARFFYCAKASKRDRNEGLDGFELKQTVGGGGLTADLREDGSLETASAGGKYGSIKAKQTNHHPTVKPTDLMRYLCRLITPPNGTVLDPFMGSGSTGKAAMYEGFKFIGVEMTDEYLPIAKARIEFAVSDNDGFLL
jgi:site-specific DNA-methyltransferase (adenine-specific)